MTINIIIYGLSYLHCLELLIQLINAHPPSCLHWKCQPEERMWDFPSLSSVLSLDLCERQTYIFIKSLSMCSARPDFRSETRALLLLLCFFVLPPWQVPLHCFIVLRPLRAPNLALLWSPPRPSPPWPVSDMWAVIAFLCALRKLYSSSEALFWDNLGQTCFGLCSDSIFFSSLLPF